VSGRKGGIASSWFGGREVVAAGRLGDGSFVRVDERSWVCVQCG